MFGSILKAVAGPLIGGLFGGKDKPQTTSTTVDYQKMVESATKAGFNPLTALRNGGSAGFTNSTTSGGQPALSSYVGAALSGGVDAWLSHDPMKEMRAQKEYDLLDAQLRNLDAQTNNLGKYGSFNVPVRTAGQVVEGTGLSGRPIAMEQGTKEMTNPWDHWDVDPTAADADTFTKRYGESEIAETAWFIKQAAGDFTYNAKKAYIRNKATPYKKTPAWKAPWNTAGAP